MSVNIAINLIDSAFNFQIFLRKHGSPPLLSSRKTERPPLRSLRKNRRPPLKIHRPPPPPIFNERALRENPGIHLRTNIDDFSEEEIDAGINAQPYIVMEQGVLGDQFKVVVDVEIIACICTLMKAMELYVQSV